MPPGPFDNKKITTRIVSLIRSKGILGVSGIRGQVREKKVKNCVVVLNAESHLFPSSTEAQIGRSLGQLKKNTAQ